MILLSKRHHYLRCPPFERAGDNASIMLPLPGALLKDNYGRLIDFLSQIKKLSCFNLLDLADFLMHASLVSCFVFWCGNWQPLVCANAAAHLCLQYVHHFELHHWFRRIDHNGSTSSHLFCLPSSSTYNSHIIKNVSFLVYFMHVLKSCRV